MVNIIMTNRERPSCLFTYFNQRKKKKIEVKKKTNNIRVMDNY